MKKYFFTTAIIMATFGAFGANGTITGGAGTCTFDVLGVSDNNATANTIATWTLNEYECGAGQYLLNSDGTLKCTECPVGSYCPGGKFTVESENNGTNACPTDYTSDAGAVGENECYIGCELSCSTNVECPPHSNNCTHSEFKTTGKQFAGGTCNAYPSVCPINDFQCDTGYSKTEMTLDEFEELAKADNGSGLILECPLSGNGLSENDNIDDCKFLRPGEIMILSGKFYAIFIEVALNDYSIDTPGIVTKKIQQVSPYDDEYVTFAYLPNANFNLGGNGQQMWARYSKVAIPGPDTMVYLGMAEQGFETEDEMMVYLQQNLSPAAWESFNSLMTRGDQESMFEWMLSTMNIISVDMPWVTSDKQEYLQSLETKLYSVVILDAFGDEHVSEDFMKDLEESRNSVSYCAANTINIDWNPDNNGEHIKNMCTYDGSITVPSDPVKPGYTFTGWKLLEETTTE